MANGKPGRPQHAPTQADRDKVKTMCGLGIPDENIATVMGITPPTLRKHYKLELRTGDVLATTNVAQSLYAQATNKEKPNVVAAIFWLKCRAGWREQDEEAGKKEAAIARAKRVSRGKFAPGAAPKLVVDNTAKAALK